MINDKKTSSVQRLILLDRYVKRVPFFNARDMKGVPFKSKIVYKTLKAVDTTATLPSSSTPASRSFFSLRDRRSKGKGEGTRARDHAPPSRFSLA